MPLDLTPTNMQLFFPSWLKPLSNQEIMDFINTPYIEEKRLWFPDWPKNLEKVVKKDVNKSKNQKYTTKKAIRQEIKNINEQLEYWLERKLHPEPNKPLSKEVIASCEIWGTEIIQPKTLQEQIDMDVIWSEIHLEELFKEKEQLKSKLRYTGVKFDNNNLERAKQRPISDYIKFQGGKAKCIFHDERSPSMHYYAKTNHVFCFGGCGKKDVIDVVQNLHNCDLPAALKIILG